MLYIVLNPPHTHTCYIYIYITIRLPKHCDEEHDKSHPQKILYIYPPSAQKSNFSIVGPYVIRYFKILFHVFQPQPTKVNRLLHHFTFWPSNSSLEKINLFLWCHIRHVKTTHIVCHLSWTTPSKQQYECCKFIVGCHK